MRGRGARLGHFVEVEQLRLLGMGYDYSFGDAGRLGACYIVSVTDFANGPKSEPVPSSSRAKEVAGGGRNIYCLPRGYARMRRVHMKLAENAPCLTG